MLYYPPTYPQDKEIILKKLFLYLRQRKVTNRKELNFYIRSFLKKEKVSNFYPKVWYLNFVYHRYFKEKKINNDLLRILRVVKVRSLSGIVPLSVFTSPKNSCPFNCLYCATVREAPKSYFSDEAAVMRAIRAKYDPFQQTFDRLVQFFLSGHPIDKVEVIVQGGTFSFYDRQYRRWFIKRVFDALNTDIEKIINQGKVDFSQAGDLVEAKKINENAPSRMVGLTIETRPDFINEEEIVFLRELGVTRVELGVQSTDDEILKLINRGHKVLAVKKATRLLRDAGFKITYHLMPGLPGSSFVKDIKMLKDVFENEDFKPDNIKFYPTQLVKNSPLVSWYQLGKFQPINEDYLKKLTEEFTKNIVPSWVRINRFVRDLTRNDLVIETFPSNFRQNIEKYLQDKGIQCPCIRCREIKDDKVRGKLSIKIQKYKANGGFEFFIEAVDDDYKLLGYLRLRIASFTIEKINFFVKCLEGATIIRELHVLGEATPLSQEGKIQHRGLGKKLIEKATEITKDFGLKKIAVISAVGTREYYRRLGFKFYQEGEYLIKNLES